MGRRTSASPPFTTTVTRCTRAEKGVWVKTSSCTPPAGSAPATTPATTYCSGDIEALQHASAINTGRGFAHVYTPQVCSGGRVASCLLLSILKSNVIKIKIR